MNLAQPNLLQKWGIQLPPQPQTLLELQRLLARDDYDLREVARVIAEDPAIVAKLFRLAKSPAFARGRRIDSLDQLLMVVGIRQTFSLIQAESFANSLSSDLRRTLETFWSRLREIAQFAALIADERRLVSAVPPEQAYLAGIFHECGVAVLMLRFPDYCRDLQLNGAAAWPDFEREDQRLGVDHCTVGYLVAKHWGLPDFVCEAIRSHHEPPSQASAAGAAALLATIQLAARCHDRLHRLSNPLWERIGASVLSELALTADEEKDYCEQMIARLLEVS